MDDYVDGFNQFNTKKPYIPASPDETYDFEDWEIEYEIIEHEDWHGLIRYRQSVLAAILIAIRLNGEWGMPMFGLVSIKKRLII